MQGMDEHNNINTNASSTSSCHKVTAVAVVVGMLLEQTITTNMINLDMGSL